MNNNSTDKEQNKCQESCSCKTDKKIKDLKNLNTIEDIENKIEQDPTKFGDWQVNGRAIDF